MEQERRSIRVGLAVIACAVVFRLLGSGVLQSAAAFLSHPEALSLMVYLETGRIIRQSPPQEPIQPETLPTVPAALPEALPSFTAADAEGISLKDNCDYEPDLEALVQQPLTWDLTEEGPAVLILHTHTSESYTKTAGENYEETSDYRTLEERCNMLSIGDKIAEILEGNGIQVLHDRTYHDYPEYNGSYGRARTTVREYLAQYPSIQLVLDIHRDAIADSSGNQLRTTAAVDGEASAQLMLVVGSDAGGLNHPNWQENLSLAAKLQLTLEREDPGICRPITLRTERFNQDLLPGMLLVEVGTAGNTHTEALRAAQALAEGIIRLAKGTER